MKIASPWKITWDPEGTPLVLVDYDQKIEDELRFPARQKVITREVIEGTDSDFLSRDLWSQTLELTVYKTHASDAAARMWCLTHVAAAAAVGRKDLQIEWDDGASGTDSLIIPGAVLSDIDPGRDPLGELVTSVKYTFKGGRMRAPEA